jgi:hypothetical protein
LARLVAEGEETVLVEDQAFDFLIFVEHLGRQPGEGEAGPAIGHEAESSAEHIRAKPFAVRLIAHAQHRGSVAVVDELGRHEGVQQHFHRGRRRQRIEKKGTLHARHLGVGELRA